MSDASVVAGRLQPVMPAECRVGLGLVLAIREIAVGGREAIGAMFAGHAAELPERLLETFRQGREALAAGNRLDEPPSGIGKPEMVDEMRERLSRQGDAERSGMGEVRERLPPGRVILAEDQFTVRSLGRTPLGNASLQ